MNDTSIPLQNLSVDSDVETRKYVFVNDNDVNKKYTLEEALELAGHHRYNYLVLFTCCFIIIAAAMDVFGFAVVVTAASCDLDLNVTRLGILAACPLAGVIFAYPWGYFIDTQGRKRALLLSTTVGFVCAIISSFSTHWIFMLVMKLVGCSFSLASFILTETMLGECTARKHRSRYLFFLNCINMMEEFFSYALAWLILPLNIKIPLSWLGITFKSWRLYTLFMAIPLGISVCLMTRLYESPKYLASRGQYAKALDVLQSIYERNGGNREYYPVKHLIRLPSDLDNAVKNQSLWSSLKRQTLPIFQPPLLWRTIQLFFLVSLCCVTNNAFLMWYPTFLNQFFNSFEAVSSTDQTFCERLFKETNKTTVGIKYVCSEDISLYTIYTGMIYGLFFGIYGLTILRIASRPKLLIIIVLSVSGISFLCVNVKQPIANVIFFTLLQTTMLGLGCLTSYFVNLYPTMHRGLLSSLSLMVGRLSSLVGVSIVGKIITEHCEATFYTWSVFVFGGVLVSLLLPADKKIMN